MLKIERVIVRTIAKPFDKPLHNALYAMYNAHHIFVELVADGVSGIGEVVCFEENQANSFHAYVEGLAGHLIGQDASLIRKHWKNFYTTMGGIGHIGLSMQALGAVDMALWDLNAKAAGLPVWRMLGAVRTEVPVYVTGGWLGTDEELVQEALSYREAGYKRFKMKLGKKDWRQDISRVRKVQEACGPDFEVMVDVNQGWDRKKSLRMAPLIAELGVTHFEEPIAAEDYEGQRYLREHTTLDVVAGEKLCGIHETSELLMRQCVDKMNPDLARCGGVTGYMEVLSVADVCRIPVSSHAYSSFSAACIAAAPTGDMLEIIPTWDRNLFEEEFPVEDGVHRLTEKPGFGCALSERALGEWCTRKTERK